MFHPLHSSVAYGPWEHLQIDMQTALPPTPRGNRYLLVIFSTFTRYAVLTPLQSKEARPVADALLKAIATFGLPSSIQTDMGREFDNALWKHILDTL